MPQTSSSAPNLPTLSSESVPRFQRPCHPWLNHLAALLLGFVYLFPFTGLQASPPPSGSLFPAGGRVGSTFTVTVDGKWETWPAEAWSYPTGILFTAQEEKGKFRVTIAQDTFPGPRWVRFLNEEGSSPPQLFQVGAAPELDETEQNDTVPQALGNVLTNLPVVINGRLESRGDVDCFAIDLTPGQPMVARLECYVLDSPVDPMLHLVDAEDVPLLFRHDGWRLDPVLHWTAAKAGLYVIKVSGFAYPPRADVSLTGDKAAVYRLHLFTGPTLRYVFPPVLTSSMDTGWQVFRWSSHDLNTPPTLPGAAFQNRALPWRWPGQEWTWIQWPHTDNLLCLPYCELSQALETEPNESLASARPLTLPAGINGRIDAPGDVDAFPFQARKGDRWQVCAQSASLEFPSDIVVEIHNDDGKVLQRQDDNRKEADPDFSWQAPEDGTYAVVVRDLFGHGSPHHVYHLDVREERSEVTARLTDHTFAVEPGQEIDIKVETACPKELAGQRQLVLVDLPSGLNSEPVTIPEKPDSVTLKLKASAEAEPGHWPLRILLRPVGDENPDLPEVVVPVKGRHAEQGDLLLNTLPYAWLTVRSAKPID